MPSPPLRLVPRRDDHAAAEAALFEAVVTSLPPAGRVLVAGDAVAWLADALDVVEATAVCTPLPTGDAGDLLDDGGHYDAVVVDAAVLGDGVALATLSRALAPGGQLLVQAPAGGTRSMGGWVRLIARSGLLLCDLREPEHGGLAGCIFVAEAVSG